PWHTHKADMIGRHVGTFEPTAHPEVDPDDEAGYRRALAADRLAIATGQHAPSTHRALLAAPESESARRLAALGSYVPRTVAAVLADHRPRRAAREQAAAENLPDALDVPCPYEHCLAPAGDPCRNARRQARTKPHPSRLDDARARHNTRQEQPA
ncbi:zinc finger domain-containing protein, partial [Streptomyces phaeochromogenes]